MTKDQIRENIIAICRNNLGTVESPKGSNKTHFGEWYGMNGVSWCGVAVSYVYNYAGWCLPKIDTELGFHYVPTLFFRAIQNKWTTNDPKPGDIFLIDFDGNGRFDHTGIFDRWADESKKEFYSYEGNTSSGDQGSQSNGDGFFLKKRRYDKKKVIFVNILDQYNG